MALSFEEVKRRQRERLRGPRPQKAEKPPAEAANAPDALTAQHKGGGYYDVHDSDGNVVAESVRKDEAQQLVEGET